MKLDTFFEKFNLLFDVPDALPKMRELVLQLAVQGKLIPQDPNEEPVVLSSDEPSGDAPHNIPPNWRWVCLGELAQFINGDRSKNYPSKSYRVAAGVPFINAGHLSNGDVLLDDMDYITEEHFDRLGGGKVQRGDVLYCLRGSLGKCAVVSSISRGAIASSLLIIRPKDMIIASYLYACLMSPLGALMIVKYDNGSAQPNLSATNVKKYLLPLPPLSEQKRIVAKVDELMALCDRLEAQQKEREGKHAALARASLARFAEAPTPDNLYFIFHKSYDITPADLRQTILTLAVQGKLVPQDPEDEPAEVLLKRIAQDRAALLESGYPNRDEATTQLRKQTGQALPEDLEPLSPGWAWATLMQASLLIVDCHNKTAPYVDSGIRLLRTTNIRNGRMNLTEPRFVDEATYERWSARCIPLPGDLLITREAPMGEGCIIPEGMKICLGQRLMLIRIVPGTIDTQYLLYSLMAPDLMGRVQDKPVGATVQHLRVGGVETLLTPIPPLAEQRRIVAKVDELMTLVDEMETQVAVSRATGEKLLAALVAELTNGKEPYATL